MRTDPLTLTIKNYPKNGPDFQATLVEYDRGNSFAFRFLLENDNLIWMRDADLSDENRAKLRKHLGLLW